MSDRPDGAPAVWADAELAAALLAVDAPGLGGIRLRARAGPVRDRWLATLESLCRGRPIVRMPLHADADALAGGLDLAATLRAGRPVAERGLLHRARDGLLLVAMAERLDPDLAASIGLALETGAVQPAAVSADRAEEPIRFGVVALDEGIEVDERTPAGLADRLAIQIDLASVTVRECRESTIDPVAVGLARERLASIQADDTVIETLCEAAFALGIGSLRAPWLAFRVARAAAALDGREAIDEQDIAIAARLVLAPRATTLPAGERQEDEPFDEPAETEAPPSEGDDEPAPETDRSDDDTGQGPEDAEPDPGEDFIPEDALTERILEAVSASLPADLLDESRRARAARASRGLAGKSGALQGSGVRGRPAGVRPGRPGPAARLNLVETLRAAAPWQTLRAPAGGGAASVPRVQVRTDDFRVNRFKQRRETTTVFVVDASGSSALHRLAEAKGAIELLLADCYVRRDSVALITFRGTGAELLLPPTRSLVQAKRRLAELPGGGGTPVAAGLDCALELSGSIIRRGATPVVVMLTDGRANIASDGSPGREKAQQDALSAAQRLRAAGLLSLLVDTSPRPRPLAEALAAAMGARYIPLPQADAAHLSAAVRAETA
jgi:magnesium chelatase subunit D